MRIGIRFCLGLVAAMLACPLAQAERPYFNDKKFPDSQQDLKAIQNALTKHLAKARNATVCIKLDQGSGSGVIVSPDGLVLTAAHVTGGVGKRLTVVMEDGREYKAKSLGLNAETDAAMLQIIGAKGLPFVPMEPGKTKEKATYQLGDWVFSLGHSGGFDKARGSVVRLGRLVQVADHTIQSDCKLIGGDSGGPLFDMNGRLIGIHSRVGRHLEQNMHVPMHEYYTHWEAMRGKKFVGEGPFATRPVKGGGFMGVAVKGVSNGQEVTKVEKGTAADKAGILVGDIILKLNNQAMLLREDMAKMMGELATGEEVKIVLTRQGKEEVVKLTLGER